jgi:hypothetical protein
MSDVDTDAVRRQAQAMREAADRRLGIEAGWLKGKADLIDALAADVKRLRRSWLATIQAENSCPVTGGGCLSKRCGCIEEMELLMREDDALPLPGDEA